MNNANWLAAPLDPEKRRVIVETMANRIRKLPIQPDAIAFRGLSGAIVAPELSSLLGIGLIAVRKSDERSHSVSEIEATRGINLKNGYVIVDDFIATGTTVKKIANAVDREFHRGGRRATLLGVCVYGDYHDTMSGVDKRKIRMASHEMVDMLMRRSGSAYSGLTRWDETADRLGVDIGEAFGMALASRPDSKIIRTPNPTVLNPPFSF